MKLIDYMRERGLSPEQMAAQIGDISEGHVRKLMYGERAPSMATLAKIMEGTGGQVNAADFLPAAAVHVEASPERAA